MMVVSAYGISIPNSSRNYSQARARHLEICYSPDGAYIAIAGGAEVEIYDVQTSTRVWIAPEKAFGFRSVKYSNTNMLAYTTREGHIFMRDATNKKFICSMRGTQPGPNSIAFSPDGHWLAICGGGTEATLQIWEVHSGSLKIEISTGVEGYVKDLLEFAELSGWWIFGRYCSDMDGTPAVLPLAGALQKLETRTQCGGMRIDNTYGLDTPAPDGRGTLRNWFIARGAKV